MHQLDRDKYFFHYTARDKAFEGILKEGVLRLSTYGAMRDPLEAQPWRFTFAGYGGPDPSDDEALIAHLSEYERFDREVNEGVRDCSHLLSLTIDADPNTAGEQEPFCRGWARARMWEQYAENHCGVCLVFERESLTTAVLGSNPGLVVYHRPVVYSGTGLMKPLVERAELRDNRGYAAQYINDNNESLFFTKTRDWETEHEYRFVVLGRDDSPLGVSYGDALTAVVAGERLPNWERPAVVAACEEAGAQALRVRWKNWRPGLVDLADR
jgi:Protein of unknown function (DUF2971)